jgi:hypothetical protein
MSHLTRILALSVVGTAAGYAVCDALGVVPA